MRTKLGSAAIAVIVVVASLVIVDSSRVSAGSADPPVLGVAEASAADLVAWFERRTVGSTATATVPIATLAALYLEEAATEGVRGDVAFVQAVLETGWFRLWGRVDPQHNNFAGIGVFGGSNGHRFRSARMGVRAHIQLVRGYATAGLTPDRLVHDFVAPNWVPERYRGSVKRWSDFGDGIWAADPGYGQKILTLWSQVEISSSPSRPAPTTTRGPAPVAKPSTPNPTKGAPAEVQTRTTATPGAPDLRAQVGDLGHTILPCDFDGDGRDAATLVRVASADWELPNRDVPAAGPAFRYGRPGDLPVCGDWDGDGRDGIGVFRGDRFLLRNDSALGNATITVMAGRPGAQPLVGDWDGDGRDDLGVRLGAQVALLRGLGGPIGWWYTYGRPSDVPVVGDWNGDGRDSLGVWRAGWWHLSNRLVGGRVDHVFEFGTATDRPITGRFGSRGSGIAVQRVA